MVEKYWSKETETRKDQHLRTEFRSYSTVCTVKTTKILKILQNKTNSHKQANVCTVIMTEPLRSHLEGDLGFSYSFRKPKTAQHVRT